MPVIRNGKIRDSAEIIGLFFLDAHLEYLALSCDVHEPVADLVHSCDWEKGSDTLVLGLQIFVPLRLLDIHGDRHIASEQLVWIP